jgi:hypothetical protein
MKKPKLYDGISAIFLTALCAAALSFTARPARAAIAYENPLFAFTHLLPSPFTLPAGRLVLGTSVAFGITDFLQVGTDVLSDFYKVYNANAKVAIVDYPEFALAATLGYSAYNYHDIASTNPDFSVTTWQPGLVTGFSLLEHVAWFWGANLAFSSVNLKTDGIETSGYVKGANVETDLSWAYNPKKKGVGNVLSGGLSYDATYKILGFGVSHHWRGLHVGIHYYPNADQYKVQPILAGGAAVDM